MGGRRASKRQRPDRISFAPGGGQAETHVRQGRIGSRCALVHSGAFFQCLLLLYRETCAGFEEVVGTPIMADVKSRPLITVVLSSLIVSSLLKVANGIGFAK